MSPPATWARVLTVVLKPQSARPCATKLLSRRAAPVQELRCSCLPGPEALGQSETPDSHGFASARVVRPGVGRFVHKTRFLRVNDLCSGTEPVYPSFLRSGDVLVGFPSKELVSVESVTRIQPHEQAAEGQYNNCCKTVKLKTRDASLTVILRLVKVLTASQS